MATAAVLAPRAPPTVVGPKTTKPTRPTKKLPQYLIEEARAIERVSFDPKRHLNIVPPAKITTMKEIGLDGAGISPNAISEPFPIFTEEAIRQMRAELFSESVLANCQYSSTFASNMIRCYGASSVIPHFPIHAAFG
jgi:hypothetical protein